jgi:hypothetical protein
MRLTRQLRRHAVEREKELLAAASAGRAASVGDARDRRIVETLRGLVPGAALAYEQALIDLASVDRLSWRWPATDFREALRETLDHLAPDADVMAQPGFKLEPNTTVPTMKQKTRFVLRKRRIQRSKIEASETAVEAIDTAVGAFVRSVYTRSSTSTHTATDRDEVIRIREFVRVALGEVLEIRDA